MKFKGLGAYGGYKVKQSLRVVCEKIHRAGGCKIWELILSQKIRETHAMSTASCSPSLCGDNISAFWPVFGKQF